MLLRQQVDAYKQVHFWFTIKFQLALLDSSLVGLYCSMRPVTILFFFGSLNQFQNVVIKRILNCCIQISHNNFEYLLDMQFQISFSLIFFQKMFRLCPLCSGSIRVRSNSFFEHSHLPIGACVPKGNLHYEHVLLSVLFTCNFFVVFFYTRDDFILIYIKIYCKVRCECLFSTADRRKV